MNHQCIVCNAPVSKKRPNQSWPKNCGAACIASAARQRRLDAQQPRACTLCGKPTPSRLRHYCGPACESMRRTRRAVDHFTCGMCEQEWTRKPTKGRVPRFCPPCRESLRKAAHAGLPCMQCGRIGRRTGGSYCSRQCVRDARPPKPKPVPAPRQAKPEQPPKTRHAKECPRCGTTFLTWRAADRFCSRRCQRKQQRIARRVREAGTFGEWRWSDFMRIAAKFNYCCAYCGDKPDRLDPDHVVPLSKGGHNGITNLLPTCPACNCDKRDVQLAEWNADRARRGLPPRRTTWDESDTRYHHLTTVRASQHAA